MLTSDMLVQSMIDKADPAQLAQYNVNGGTHRYLQLGRKAAGAQAGGRLARLKFGAARWRGSTFVDQIGLGRHERHAARHR